MGAFYALQKHYWLGKANQQVLIKSSSPSMQYNDLFTCFLITC